MGNKCGHCDGEHSDPAPCNAQPSRANALTQTEHGAAWSDGEDGDGEPEPRAALGLQGAVSQTLPPRLSQLSAAGRLEVLERAGTLDVDFELLRAVPMRSCPQRAGRIWSKNPADITHAKRVELSEMSEEAKSFDVFISHCWSSSGHSKFLYLLLREGTSLALLIWCVFAVIAMLLCSAEVLPMPADYVIKILNFRDPAPFGFWVFGPSLGAMAVGLALTPYLPSRNLARCFVDVVSINQAWCDL